MEMWLSGMEMRILGMRIRILDMVIRKAGMGMRIATVEKQHVTGIGESDTGWPLSGYSKAEVDNYLFYGVGRLIFQRVLISILDYD